MKGFSSCILPSQAFLAQHLSSFPARFSGPVGSAPFDLYYDLVVGFRVGHPE
jgi:hypothetical protein